MRKLSDKKKAILIVGAVDGVLLLYLAVLLLTFLKVFGKADKPVSYLAYQYQVTNEIIDAESSLIERTFTYVDEDKSLRFSTTGLNASIGTYAPHTYIYGTTSGSLTISFKIEGVSLAKVTYDEIKTSDINGENVKVLSPESYTTFKELGWFVLKYTSDYPKYIYSVSLTYYVIK